MRVLAAAFVAALATAAGAQAASFPPLFPQHGFPVIDLGKANPKGTLSCTAHARAKLGKTKHRLVPVACEQPPRSRVRDAGFVITLAP